MADPFEYTPQARPHGRPIYCAFRLNRDGSFGSAEIIQAKTDDEAKTIVQGMAHDHGIDLWERDRLVESYPRRSMVVWILSALRRPPPGTDPQR